MSKAVKWVNGVPTIKYATDRYGITQRYTTNRAERRAKASKRKRGNRGQSSR